AQAPVGVANRRPDGALGLGLALELALDCHRRPVQQLSHRDVRVALGLAAPRRLVSDVRLPEQVLLEEVVDRDGHVALPLGLPAAPLPPRPGPPPAWRAPPPPPRGRPPASG